MYGILSNSSPAYPPARPPRDRTPVEGGRELFPVSPLESLCTGEIDQLAVPRGTVVSSCSDPVLLRHSGWAVRS
jgi:hypothetical protein